jgi:hypothetical protein
MAQGSRNNVDETPATIRAEIAETRAALAMKLGALKERALGNPNEPHQGAKKTMATKKTGGKAGSSRAGAKKKASSAPSAASRASKASKASKAKTSKKPAAKQLKATGSRLVTKAKKVAGAMLAGAAAGAVKGAADAVAPSKGNTGRGQEEDE